jgi:hypothetical protein
MADGSDKLIEDLIVGDEVLTAVIPTYPNGEDMTKWYPLSVWGIQSLEGTVTGTTTVTGVNRNIAPAFNTINGSINIAI